MLSLAQERLWFGAKMAGDETVASYTSARRLTGPLDISALHRALTEIFCRHEILRTSFPGDVQPAVLVREDVTPELPLIDLTDLAPEERESAARRHFEHEAARPFRLDRWPLLRFSVVRLAEDQHLLIGSVHHIICDGWSTGLFHAELSQLYAAFTAGRSSPLSQPRLQYTDFASWQRRWSESPPAQEHLAYWKRQLAGHIPPLQLPTDRPRTSTRAFRGGSYSFHLPEGLAGSILDLARASGTTPFTALLAAFATLLHRATGQDEFAIGSPVANRSRRELESVLGCFMHPLVLRCNLAGDPTFGELLARIREVCLAAYAHQDAPFELVVRAVRPQWDQIHTPLVQVVFNVQRSEAESLRLQGLRTEFSEIHSPVSALDLSVNLWIDREQVRGVVEYAAELFDEATIAWLMRCFQSLLQGIVTNPDQRISQYAISGRKSSDAAVAGAIAPGLSAKRQELLRLLLGQSGPADEDDFALRRESATNGSRPCSFGQERLWFVEQLQPGSTIFHQSRAIELEGLLDVALLRRAIDEVLRRHEILRTAIVAEAGRPVQVAAPTVHWEIPLVDLSHLPSDQQETEAGRLVSAQAERPFDLSRPPLVHGTLIRYSPERHSLQLTVHHLIGDGWSIRVFHHELAALYAAFTSRRDSPLPELKVQYSDFAAWQRRSYRDAIVQGQLTYWKERLAGPIPVLELPVDRPRQRGLNFHRKERLHFSLPPNLTESLAELRERTGATPFMIFLTAFYILLNRYSGHEDILVDTPVSGRNRREIEGLIGFFVNSLVLRADLSGQPTFCELLNRVREHCLGAYQHQDLPFDQVVAQLQLTRDRNGQPLTPVSFMLHEKVAKQEELGGGVRMSFGTYDMSDEFDLTLVIWQSESGFAGDLQYHPWLFIHATAARMAEHYQTLLSSVIEHPDRRISELAVLPEGESRQLLYGWNATKSEFPRGLGLHELFEQRAEEREEAPAVILPAQAGSGGPEERLTYGELNGRANQLARYLRTQGVGPETRVGLALERTPELLVALWAVLKAGGAYVPLDPAHGRERLRHMLADSRASLVLTQSGLLGELEVSARIIHLDQIQAAVNQEADTNLNLPVDERQLAYVIYTSGSTGKPKGVMVAHQSLVNAYYAWQAAYGLDALRCHLQMASFPFDVFGGDLTRALASGASLVLCPRETLLMGAELAQLIDHYQVDCAEFVPAVVRGLLEHLTTTGQRLSSLKLMIVGSDTWHISEFDELQQLLGPEARLINSYGVAEATIDSTYFEGGVGELAGEALVPIGRPFANTRLYVLDPYLNPVPIGAAGELYLGGAGLGRGYCDQPGWTAQRYVPDPFSNQAGARLYRTGDRARYQSDGTLAFLGRVDQQIKIRGQRIEPGEIEACLSEHPAVQRAVVVAREGRPRDLQLVAYAVLAPEFAEMPANGSENPTNERETHRLELTAELRRHLRERLPEYMIPGWIEVLDRLPLSPNGKVDRRALPAPRGSSAASETFSPPQTEVQRKIAAIWSEVLGVDQVGLHDNFFDLGGHSLRLVELHGKLRAAFSLEIPLVELFRLTTVDDLARRFAGAAPSGPSFDEARERANKQRQALLKRQSSFRNSRPPARTRAAHE